MGLFDGKKGLIVGVANDRSIAWHIAKFIMDEGGVCGYTHLPDRPDDERRRNHRRVNKITSTYPEQTKFLVPLNVQDDDQIAEVIDTTKSEFGEIDFLLHSVAFAHPDDLNADTVDTSREGFKNAMDISAYSLVALTKAARPILTNKSSVLAMTYFGGEKCVPGYNVMGICKAALDAIVRYLAFDLGPDGIRVNAVSAGPLKTISGVGAGVDRMLSLYEKMSPTGTNITHEDVGRAGGFLLSDLAMGITSEILHVDNGYNAMGSPGRLLDDIKDAATS